MNPISNLISDDFMSRFKLFHSQTLFEPNWNALLIDRCALCGNRLKFPRARRVAICNGKKHKPFVITVSRLNEIKNQYEKL